MQEYYDDGIFKTKLYDGGLLPGEDPQDELDKYREASAKPAKRVPFEPTILRPMHPLLPEIERRIRRSKRLQLMALGYRDEELAWMRAALRGDPRK